MGQEVRSVLVVDDNPDLREALTFVLEAEGYTVTAASDGREALERLHNGGPLPRVILLDLSMPNMDGSAFRQHQLQDPRLARIPLVVCSGERGARDAALRLGANGYIAKPMDVDTVLQALDRVFLCL
jgi:CheY-like chemotaxis protein